MTMSPGEGEDILAFGSTDPLAGRSRTRVLLGAGGAGLAGAAVAVGLLAFGGGTAPAAYHQTTRTLTQRAVDLVSTGIAFNQMYSGDTLIGPGRATVTVPARSGRVVTLKAGTGRSTCHH